MDYAATLLARADELMKNAPGRVTVRRVSQIDEVKIVRAARAALSPEDEAQLAELRLQVSDRLEGAQAATAPPPVEKKTGLFGALLSPLAAVAKGASKEMRAKGEFDHMVRQSGGATSLPAPVDLLDAAELWAIAQLVGGEVDGDIAILRSPWEEATIEPA